MYSLILIPFITFIVCILCTRLKCRKCNSKNLTFTGYVGLHGEKHFICFDCKHWDSTY